MRLLRGGYAGARLCALPRRSACRPPLWRVRGHRDLERPDKSGLFELSFSDPRYLPFEFKGAISRWRIELPPENNYFDLDTLTDTIIRLNYTAREGGNLLRRAARVTGSRTCVLPSSASVRNGSPFHRGRACLCGPACSSSGPPR